ncbi:hypothetical protein N9V88_00375 [bacterium]|nr:hypothetical protein [bacterium]
MSSASDRLRKIKRFDQLLAYLRDELDWPVDEFEFDELTYDWEPEELGIETKLAAKIQEIKQMRPLATDQQWGIFFVKFEPKRLPMVAMRRLLNRLVMKKRASAQKSDQASWRMHDLLFISQYGEGEERKISFAQFAKSHAGNLADLKVLTWGETQTDLTLEDLDNRLHDKLTWPEDPADAATWRAKWSSAFTRRHGHVIRTSKELAAELATLAKAIYTEAVKILEIENENGPLTKLYRAFQQALIHDLEEKKFADMYAQTITYGLFSTAVSGTDTVFGQGTFVNTERMVQLVPNTNPFLREMLSAFLTAGGENGGMNFDELGINEVVELLNDEKTDLPAIIREFGAKKKDEDPVIHFYEEFLKAYNAKLRFQRGVFYTPQPVVSYIVRSVHELLQTEFGLEDGLADTTTWGEMVERFNATNTSLKRKRVDSSEAESETDLQPLTIPDGMTADDPFVQILDPATGTATFLVEVIDVIHKTMTAKWKKAGKNEAQCRDAWNEYVPQHLLPRVYGYELMMAPYAIAHMKIGLKLTETSYRFASEERARIYLTNALEPPNKSDQKLLGDWFPALAAESKQVDKIKKNTKYTVILGNPPYSGLSANMSDDAQEIIDRYRYVDGKRMTEKKLWLQDDYVKFLRFSELRLAEAGLGLLGFITNHSYMDNPTFRGMRESMHQTFGTVQLVDLNGSTKRPDVIEPGQGIKNVFDIQQGVSILIAHTGASQQGVLHFSLLGNRELKYKWLAKHTVADSGLKRLSPDSPYYFFIPRDTSNRDEYQRGWQINEAMPVNCAGVITARDHFVVDVDANILEARVAKFRDGSTSDSEIRRKYFAGKGSSKYPDGDTRGWKLGNARNKVRKDPKWKKRTRKMSYRPFDKRFVYWAEWMVDWDRSDVMQHMLLGPNHAIHVCRQCIGDEWCHALATDDVVDDSFVSNKSRERGYAHPLYIYPDPDSLEKDAEKVPNFSLRFLSHLATTINREVDQDTNGLPNEVSSEEIFGYVYGVLYSPSYRARFAPFLRVEFPRIPLPSSYEFFVSLSRLGTELVQCHLLQIKAPNLVLQENLVGEELVNTSWEVDTVWIDKPRGLGVANVSEQEWEFRIGGYQPLQKWLKDRQAKGGKNPRPGRKLTKEDIEHYQKMVVAIRETIRLMGEIDEVIEQHGGWPDAFATEPIEPDSTNDPNDGEPKLPFP